MHVKDIAPLSLRIPDGHLTALHIKRACDQTQCMLELLAVDATASRAMGVRRYLSALDNGTEAPCHRCFVRNEPNYCAAINHSLPNGLSIP